MARGLKILVVEDDSDLADALAEVLTEEGYRVMYARDGAAALELLAGEIPDLILLDLMMPGMNGWAFRERQLQDSRLRGIPVLVLTALDHPERGIDADGFIRKPISLDGLLLAIKNLLRHGHE